MSAPAEIVNLDDYRRDDESGMWKPAHLHTEPIEPDLPADEDVEDVEQPAGEQKPSSASEQGRTKTVAQREQELAEARRLVVLQDQDLTAEVDTKKVRRARKFGVQARKLHALRQRPEAVALRDARVRLATTVMAMAAAVAALGWSTASVQQTAAHGAPAGTTGYALAFLVEPLISLGLLAVIGVQAYAAMRGGTVDPDSEHGRVLKSTQRWLLTLTVTLNTWPYVSPLWGPGEFDLIQVVVHLVGPIVAVRMIHSLPAMWAVLEDLALPTPRATGEGVTAPACSENATAEEPSSKGPPRVVQVRDELAALIAAGRWNRNVSVPAIREHFECGVDIARQVRDQIKPASTA